jgi:TolB protein
MVMAACGETAPKTTSPTKASPSTSAASESPDPFAGETAWIAYQTDRGGEGTWLIHPDGTGDHEIAAGFAGDLILPDWSPDGRRLVLTSRNTGGSEPLYEYDLKTETLRQLFACKAPCLGDDEPVYSPDGRRVAFIRALGPLQNDLPSDCGFWIGDLSTAEVEQVTRNASCDRENFLRWSPDGAKLTYWREKRVGDTIGTAVFVMTADGTGERQLTDWNMFAGDPDWSPDGEWIVFNTHPLPAFNFESVVSDLFRMHPDGSGSEQLTHYESKDLRATQPRYSPDGDRILFTTVTSSSRSLSVIPAAGGEPIMITQGGIYTHGTWQPGH